MSTITDEQMSEITALLADCHLCVGVGNSKHEACSIAAINLALTGRLTDIIPECMSSVIGRWIICIQDDMPDDMRNSAEWRNLLPLAAGTGLEKEAKRLALIMDWMWSIVLPTVQPVADRGGFGKAWAAMCEQRTSAYAASAASAADYASAASAAYAAFAAAEAAEAAEADYAAAYAYAAEADYAAAEAAEADYAAAYAAEADYAAAYAAAAAAAYAAAAADFAADYASSDDCGFWKTVNPAALLGRLIIMPSKPDLLERSGPDNLHFE